MGETWTCCTLPVETSPSRGIACGGALELGVAGAPGAVGTLPMNHD